MLQHMLAYETAKSLELLLWLPEHGLEAVCTARANHCFHCESVVRKRFNVHETMLSSCAAGMWVPGAAGLVVGALLLLLVRDSPEAVGYPPVETVQAKPKEKDGSDAPKESLMSLLLNNVLKNPFIWGMAFTYFFVYVVRQGVTSWFVFYLIKVPDTFPRPLGFSRPLAGFVLLILVRWCIAP